MIRLLKKEILFLLNSRVSTDNKNKLDCSNKDGGSTEEDLKKVLSHKLD